MSVVLILPSLKISGGTREALRLALEARSAGRHVRVLCMWNSPHAMCSELPVERLSEWTPRATRAPLQLPALMRRFSRWQSSRATANEQMHFVFTHYATLPLALLVPRNHRLFFVQDLEWRFLGNGVASALIRSIVKFVYKTGRIISANAYLTKALKREGFAVSCEMPIWADAGFAGSGAAIRDIDYVMVLRKGVHKRIDIYEDFIACANKAGRRVAVITPEDEIAVAIADRVAICALRPSALEMRALYGRSKCFIHASDHEGFGLPPLEAMGSGCVPICRNSGGVQAYMDEDVLRDLLMPLSMPTAELHAFADALICNVPALLRYSESARKVFASGAKLRTRARDAFAEALN